MWRDYAEVLGDGVLGVAGSFRVWAAAEGPQPGDRRDIVVWLPPGYSPETRRYPVIYFQDGQNVFDPATAFSDHWRAAETLVALAEDGLPAIAVGVSNLGEARVEEYAPFADAEHGGGRGLDYVRFLTARVRPAVDAAFATRKTPASTVLVGSSLGGVISLVALFHRPDVFGRVAAFSPSAWFADAGLRRWLRPRPRFPARIYLDTGRWERGRPDHAGWLSPWLGHPGSQAYVRDVVGLYRELLEKGYAADRDVRLVIDADGEHAESAWARRLPGALRWLLDPAR